MKKILSVFLMSFIVFALSACNADVVKMEDYEWKMRTVMSNDTEAAQYQDELVVAVGEVDELYPDAEIVDMTFKVLRVSYVWTQRYRAITNLYSD